MTSSLDNIFGDTQEDKVKNTNTSQSRTVSSDPLSNIFANSPKPTAKQVAVETATKPAEPEGFLSKAFDKTASFVGKVATSVGDWFNKQQQKNDEASFQMRETMYGKTKFVTDPVTGKNKLTTDRLEAFNNAKTPEEKAAILEQSNQEIPLIKFLNSDTGKKVTGTIYKSTSNLPLKAIAAVKAIGDDTYDEAYAALQAKAKDPNNSRFEKIMYGLQDSGVQSAIGALLAAGTAYLTRNPRAGQAVSLAYFAPISAESQRQEKGKVESLGNIAIDTVGDTVISGFAESALKSVIKEGGEAGLKTFAKEMGKGFLVEGGTEPTQTFLKYANDYKNAKTEAEKQKVVADVTNYVKSGGMVDEFLIGGLSGAGITGVAAGAGKVIGGGTNVPVEPSLQSNGMAGEAETPKGTVKAEFNYDFSKVRDEANTLTQQYQNDPTNEAIAQRLAGIQDQLNDYQQAVKQRPVYISDETQDNPLATIETVQYPDGKFSYAYSADTGTNKAQSPFSNTETFATQKEAIEAGKKEILNWVKSRLPNAETDEVSKLNEIENEIKSPTDASNVKIQKENKQEPITTVNPSGKGVFEDYESGIKYRATAPLGENIVTYDQTAEIKPTDKVKIYRGGLGEIQAGDFVTTNEQLAKDYAGNGKVYSKEVNASDILDDKSEPMGEEYIYRPKETEKPLKKEQETKEKKPTEKVEKKRVGVYSITQYNQKGEAQGKVEARFTRSKRNNKLYFEVTKDGERIVRMSLADAKKKYGTTDRAVMVERAVNGKFNKETGKWEMRQSNAPVIKNTTQNQVEKKPVKTRGEVKNSKAFQRVQERLGAYADMDVNYNRLNLADDTAKALEFIEKNPKEAKRIALGMQGAPEGVTETAISIALAEQAADNKDYALQAQLERSRSLRQTRRGQEIVAERGRFNENSPHFFMQQVLAARMENAGKTKFKFLTKRKGDTVATGAEAKIKEGTENVKQTVKKKLSAAELAQNVIDQLTC